MLKFYKYIFFSFLFFFISKAFSTEIISNFGRTGLLEIPTAYKINDGHLLIGTSRVYPYIRPYVNVGFFPGLEMGGVITIIENISVENNPTWSGYGNYKDKAFFMKYQILPEMGKYPAIAVGWDDFHGTKLFESKYIVITRYIDSFIPQNLTIGYSTGVLDGFFWGTEVLLHPKLSFIAEYAPLDEKKLKGINNIKTDYNLGLKFQPTSWFLMTLSFQRGQEFGINIAFDMPMGKPWLPHREKYFILTKRDVELIKSNKQTQFFEEALKRLDFEYPAVYVSGDTLFIEAYNRGYFYEATAIKKILSIFKVVYFPGVRNVAIILKEKNIPIVMLYIDGKLINDYLNNKITLKDLLQKTKYVLAPDYKPKKFVYFSKPYFSGNLKMRTFLNDPSGAFKYEISYDIILKEELFNNYFLISRVSFPLTNNISSVNEPLMDEPVRSDIDKYLGYNNIKIPVLSLNYISPIFKNTFVGISAGYNELMFAGIGGDVLHFIGDGKMAVGLGGDYAIKRKAQTLLSLENYSFHDYYLRFHYTMEEPEMNFTIKAGRFLAGDKGVRVEVSRIVKGFEVGFWYTYTDTSVFSDPYNSGYRDKGVFISIPMRMFKYKDTPQTISYSLAPWTRDVGQLVKRPFDLYKIIRGKTPFYIKSKADEKE